MADAIRETLSQFGIDDVECLQQMESGSSWYVNNQYVLKAFTDLSQLEGVLLIHTHLYNEGIPVARYVPSKAGAAYVSSDDVHYTLAYKAAGSHVDPYTGDYQTRATALGKDIAKLHAALHTLGSKIPCSHTDSMDELHGWILPEITSQKMAVRKEIIDYCIHFDALYHRLPRQIIHRDIHMHNMLFENDELTAIIDFDLSQINARLFDLCYFGSSCIHQHDQDDEKVTKWFTLFHSFLSGYHSVSALSKDELDAIPHMFVFIQLLFVAFYSTIGQKDKLPECIEHLEWLYSNKGSLIFSLL